MDIDIKLETRLFDNDYGFSALLEKYNNKLTEESKKEIKELIEEDLIYMVEQCEWTITKASERKPSTEETEQHDSKALHIADVSSCFANSNYIENAHKFVDENYTKSLSSVVKLAMVES